MIAANDEYKVLFTVVMEGKVKSFGDMAVTKANEIEGLQVGETGEVIEIQGNPKAVMEHLLQKFQEIAGKAAIYSSKIHAMPVLKEHPDLQVPDELR